MSIESTYFVNFRITIQNIRSFYSQISIRLLAVHFVDNVDNFVYNFISVIFMNFNMWTIGVLFLSIFSTFIDSCCYGSHFCAFCTSFIFLIFSIFIHISQ